MATKNKYTRAELTHEIDKLMDAYKSSLGLTNTEYTDLETFSNNIAKLKTDIKDLEASIETATVEVEKLKNNQPIEDLEKEIAYLNDCIQGFTELKTNIDGLKQLQSKDAADLTNEDRETILRLSEVRNEILKEYGEAFAKLTSQFKTTMLNDLISKIEEHIKDLNTAISKKNKLTKLILLKADKERELDETTQKLEELNTKSKTSAEDTLENFELFLKNNNLSTSHAKQIYTAYKRNKTLSLGDLAASFDGNHKKWTKRLRKYGTAAVLTMGGIGAVTGVIASSGFIAGTAWGPFQVMGSLGTTLIANSIIGVGIGAGVTAGVIAGAYGVHQVKHAINKHNAKNDLESYKNSINIDSLSLSKLVEKFEKTNHKIDSLNEGNWFTKALKFIPKKCLIARNSIRANSLKDYQEYLVKEYNKIHLNNEKNSTDKANELLPIYELYKKIHTAVDKFNTESTLHEMLTCKDSSKHTHDLHFRNYTILSKMFLNIEALTKNPENIKKNLKQAKKDGKDFHKINSVGTEILNGDRILLKMLGFDKDYARFVSSEPLVNIVESTTKLTNGNVVVMLDNGKAIELTAAEIGNVENLSTVKVGKNKTILTYSDGTTKQLTTKKEEITEKIIAGRIMLDKLTNDTAFIDELKAEGFNQRTISSLVSKLETWLKDPTNTKLKISAKSNIGQLHHSALLKIDDSLVRKNRLVFKFDDSDDDSAGLPHEAPFIIPAPASDAEFEEPSVVFEIT